jgi:phenylacetate-CoA ligase
MAGHFPDRQAIRQFQLEELQKLLDLVQGANRFYQQKLEHPNPRFSLTSLSNFSDCIPFTTKQEVVADQQAFPPFGSNHSYPIDHYTRCHQTSGTGGGAPLRWLDTAQSWRWMVQTWQQIHGAAGVTAADRVFFAFSFGPFLGFWLAFEAAEKIGCLCLSGGGLSTIARLSGILDQQATVLCCTPSYAIRLAEVAAAEKVDLPQRSKIRLILVAGEPGGSIPATRNRIEQLWPGARVSDHHGMTEIGPVTLECPKQPGVLHVIEQSFFPEIIDPISSHPVSPGQRGELVLTNLGRLGSPLLRYRTGDMVQAIPQEKCACGRSDLALEGGILARVDDMVVVRGVNVYPTSVEEIVRSFSEIVEYQVSISKAGALSEITVHIEPEPDCKDPAELAARLQKSFEKSLSLRVPVQIAPVGSLPRFEMKARRWVRQ